MLTIVNRGGLPASIGRLLMPCVASTIDKGRKLSASPIYRGIAPRALIETRRQQTTVITSPGSAQDGGDDDWGQANGQPWDNVMLAHTHTHTHFRSVTKGTVLPLLFWSPGND